MMSVESITGVVVVLYRPTSEHLDNVRSARNQTDLVVVVDNTPGDGADLSELDDAQVVVVRHGNRDGLAGGLNAGVRAAIEAGAHIVQLLDQDSVIGSSYVSDMAAAVDAIGPHPALLGPRIRESKLDLVTPVNAPLAPAAATLPAYGHTPTDFIITSGTVLTAATFRLIGPFRDDYFIESIDIEYSLRAWALGVPVLTNEGVTIDHATGDLTTRGKHLLTNHNADRMYYQTRNYAHLNATLRPLRVGLRRSIGYFLRQLREALLSQRDRTRKVLAVAAGGADGARGALGPFEARHPHLYRYCTTSPRTKRPNPGAP